jgi:hypothetical protein
VVPVGSVSPVATRAQQMVVRRVERAGDELARRAVAELEDLPWWQVLDADSRSWVGLVVGAGISQFVSWMRGESVSGALVFAAAPRTLTRTVSLAQTVELVRRSVDVVELAVDELANEEMRPWLREAVLRYSRELAFAAAAVYARAAEQRGAWDARLQTLLVDAVVAGDAGRTVEARAAALGWSNSQPVVVVVSTVPSGRVDPLVVNLQRTLGGRQAVAGAHGSAVLVLCAPDVVAEVVDLLDDGPVVVGPEVADLGHANASATEALAGLRVVAGWPGAPRPVAAGQLLPERALAGEATARERLVAEVHGPLLAAGGALMETVTAFLEEAGSLEGAARGLFVHPNTVRYRLAKVADVTGLHALDIRESFVLRVALVLGRSTSL